MKLTLFLSGLWFLPIFITLRSFVLHLLDVSIYLSLCSHSKMKEEKPTRREPGKRGRSCQTGLPYFVELGISGKRKYFLRTQVLDPGNLEGSSGLLINIHKNISPPPHLVCPLPLGDAPTGLSLSAEAGLELIQVPS